MLLLQAGLSAAGVSPDVVKITQVDLAFPWEFTADGVSIGPVGPSGLTISADRIEAGLPSPSGLLSGQVSLGVITARGLLVRATAQRGAAHREDPMTWVADAVVVEDGALRIAEDPPLKAIGAEGLQATLTEVVWTPGVALLGSGAVTAESLVVGGIAVEEVALTAKFEGEEIVLTQGSLRYGEALAALTGEVSGLGSGPETEIVLTLEGARMEDLFREATGSVGPIAGPLACELTLRAGGERPRGGAEWEAQFSMREASLALDESVGVAPKVLAALAPWFRMRDGVLLIPELHGSARFGSGWAVMRSLHYQGERGDLQLWGESRSGENHWTVRTLPRNAKRSGIGMILTGPSGQTTLTRATTTDLANAPPLTCEH